MRSHLTKRQSDFITEYASCQNATKAAIKAGYAPSSAYQRGYELVNNSEVQKKLKAYGLLGIDTLAEIAQDDSYNELARVNAAKALVERAFGKTAPSKTIMPTVNIHLAKV